MLKKNYYTICGTAFLSDELYLMNAFKEFYSPLVVGLGKSPEGETIFLDLETAPHVLVGGATGSGKSVCINLIICELVSKLSPAQLDLRICDPKRVDYSIYKGLPHVRNYASEPDTITNLLAEVRQEMNERYKELERNQVRKNAELENPFPYMVVVFDELASIKNRQAIAELNEIARLGRACNIHLIIATQRPDRSVIDGQLKANCPTRIAFRMQSVTDSRVLLDRKGAQELKGKGDSFLLDAFGVEHKFQGAYIPDETIAQIVQFYRKQPTTLRRARRLLASLEPLNQHHIDVFKRNREI